MAENFYTILTNTGKAKIANATALGTKVNFTTLKVGDSNGTYYNPTETQEDLVHTVWNGNINSITTDPDNPNWITIAVVIPSNVGGFVIREVGIFDDEGDMLAIGKYPETYKPQVADGSTKDITIRMILEVSNSASVTLKVDPAVTLATKADFTALAGAGRTNETVKGNADAINAHKTDYVAHPANAGTTAGTSTAYTITTNPGPTELLDKVGAVFTVHTDSVDNPTLQWGTLEAKPILKPNGNPAILKKNGLYTVRYNSANDSFILQGEGGEYGTATQADVLNTATFGTEQGVKQGTMNLTNLTPGNVKKNVNINGVIGTVEEKQDFSNYLKINLTSKNVLGFIPEEGLWVSTGYNSLQLLDVNGNIISTITLTWNSNNQILPKGISKNYIFGVYSNHILIFDKSGNILHDLNHTYFPRTIQFNPYDNSFYVGLLNSTFGYIYRYDDNMNELDHAGISSNNIDVHTSIPLKNGCLFIGLISAPNLYYYLNGTIYNLLKGSLTALWTLGLLSTAYI